MEPQVLRVVQPVAATIPTEQSRLLHLQNWSRLPRLMDFQFRRPQMKPEVFMAVRVAILAFMIMELCHFVGGSRRFGEFFCLNLQSRSEDRGTCYQRLEKPDYIALIYSALYNLNNPARQRLRNPRCVTYQLSSPSIFSSLLFVNIRSLPQCKRQR
jgi:hypothetical protein